MCCCKSLFPVAGSPSSIERFCFLQQGTYFFPCNFLQSWPPTEWPQNLATKTSTNGGLLKDTVFHRSFFIFYFCWHIIIFQFYSFVNFHQMFSLTPITNTYVVDNSGSKLVFYFLVETFVDVLNSFFMSCICSLLIFILGWMVKNQWYFNEVISYI